MVENLTSFTELEAYVGKGEKITVRRKDLPKVMHKIIKKYGEEEILNFKALLKKALIIELRSLPPSKGYGLNKYMNEKSKPLREEIIDSIEKGFSEDNMTTKDDEINLKITIRHPLVLALNDGTGIYGPEKREIIPVNKEYMFIPGDQYARRYYMRKYSNKPERGEEAYQYHAARMTHARGVKQYEKYSAIQPGKFA